MLTEAFRGKSCSSFSAAAELLLCLLRNAGESSAGLLAAQGAWHSALLPAPASWQGDDGQGGCETALLLPASSGGLIR